MAGRRASLHRCRVNYELILHVAFQHVLVGFVNVFGADDSTDSGDKIESPTRNTSARCPTVEITPTMAMSAALTFALMDNYKKRKALQGLPPIKIATVELLTYLNSSLQALQLSWAQPCLL